VIQKIQTVYETTHDLQADFQQTTRFEGFETEVASTGRLYLKKPGMLRWDYISPNQDQVTVNQDRIWIFSPELKQVIVSPFAALSDSQMPLHLLTGMGRLDQDFEVRWTDPPKRQEGLALTLRPKDSRAGLEKIEMEVSPEQYYITRLALFENNGNTSHFTFSRIKTNKGLSDKLFIFTAPQGVEVIETAPR
jgi:outer membrane lipoprotein carrier protein